mgnify:CR=1 FL=1
MPTNEPLQGSVALGDQEERIWSDGSNETLMLRRIERVVESVSADAVVMKRRKVKKEKTVEKEVKPIFWIWPFLGFGCFFLLCPW